MSLLRLIFVQTNSLGSRANRVFSRLTGFDALLSRAVRTIPGAVDVVFPSQFCLGKSIAVINWIPDFQHCHLPEMYSPSVLRARDKDFEGIRNVTLVVVSSQDARKEFAAFAPKPVFKVRVMSFVSFVPVEIYDTDPSAVLAQYALPRKFFYLPNQFWKHKNHIAVLHALKTLKDRNICPFVVFTGNPHDHRNPEHFGNLMQKLAEWKLSDQTKLLRFVPHNHML